MEMSITSKPQRLTMTVTNYDQVNPPESLIDDRADPDSRAVLEDWELWHGIRTTRLGMAISIGGDDTADSDADADAADDVTADAAADVAADTYDAAADTDDVAADPYDVAADPESYADSHTDASNLTHLPFGAPDMTNGIKLISLPGGYYGRLINRIGWLRRVNGDEWELLGGRTIYRVNGIADVGAMEILAEKGLGENHKLSEVTSTIEEIHRLIIRRSRIANEIAWAKDCPRPDGWES